jgi:hypothetical protein
MLVAVIATEALVLHLAMVGMVLTVLVIATVVALGQGAVGGDENECRRYRCGSSVQ